jgi:selenocysteine-specific translation elongation factor
MKYLNKYVDFKESFDISSTDTPDEKLAKEEINSTEENLKEYKEKKSMIEQIFSSGKDASEIDTELKKLIPETDNSNSFLTDFIKICRVQKEIEDGKSSS